VSKKNIFLAITNGLWLIDELSAQQLGPQVASILTGEKFWSEDRKAELEVMIVSSGEKSESYYSSSASKASKGSVAILTFSGPIMKDDNCGEPGTKSFINMLSSLENNPNITGVVLVFDSPGGTVAGTQAFADKIKSFSKPTVTLAEDLMASAAYWAGSSSKFVFANNSTTRIGSIGTMLGFADMQPYWEKKGVVFHEIYATASTRKNQDFAEARKRKYEAIKAGTLDPLNDEFLAAVISNRGEKLDKEKTLSGTVYLAAEALKYGLIDGIGNLQDAINKVYELAGESNTDEQKNSQQTNMKKVTLTAAHAALLAVCGVSLAAGQDSVEVDVDALNAAVAKQSSDLATANTEAGNAKEKVTTAEDRATKAEKDLADLKAGSAGATTTSTEKVDEVTSEEKENYHSIADEELARIKASSGL
jgi:capsid assembly protease